MTYFTILCQLNNGCMGCCGHGFRLKEKIKEAIDKNTAEFKQLNPQTADELLKFRDRAHKWDLLNGVCRNLIEDNNHFFCPLHPARNEGKDLREDHCEINHLCQTAREFNLWEKEKQEKFLELVKEKELDNLDYSIQIDNNSLLKEFKRLDH
ncbi:MAG: hypothetical protein ABIA37_02965 [Candidatus Woesearchaeota archaeon]